MTTLAHALMLDARHSAARRRRLNRHEMRRLLAIEADLNDRRGYHLSSLDAHTRREIRETWKAIYAWAELC